jgi:molybdopterin molybdotransferase
VRIKPGKPVVFGRRGRVPVVGLPGNPVSAMVTFEVLVRPALRKMLGDPAPHPEPVAVRLAHDHSRSPGRLELARATLARDGEGWTARLHALQGSGSLRSMAGVDALVIFPSDRDRFVAGELLVAIRLRRRGSTRSPFEDLA